MSAVADSRFEPRAPALGDLAVDPMPRGIALSAALHVGLLLAIVLGLPNLFRTPPAEDTPIAVELVTIAPQTHATRLNRFRPQPNAKPDPAETPPAPVPERKPEPMQANAEPTAAPPPPPERTEPVPQESHEPLPPPPPMKPAAAKPEPMPPAPEPKPKPRPEERHEARHEPRPETRQEAAAFDKLLQHLEEKPREKQPRPQTASFDSLLKNLTREAPAQADEAPPRPHRMAAAAAASSQPMAPLGSQLSASEIDLLRRQIERCWVVPAGVRDAKDLDIEIKASVNPDGTVQQAAIIETGRYASDPIFRAAADSAKRAVLNPQCSPLHLPADKYEAWHNLDLFFNPKDLL